MSFLQIRKSCKLYVQGLSGYVHDSWMYRASSPRVNVPYLDANVKGSDDCEACESYGSYSGESATGGQESEDHDSAVALPSRVEIIALFDHITALVDVKVALQRDQKCIKLPYFRAKYTAAFSLYAHLPCLCGGIAAGAYRSVRESGVFVSSSTKLELFQVRFSIAKKVAVEVREESDRIQASS